MLDTGFVRNQFPAFACADTASWAFFENAGGSYLCAPVLERLDRFHREYKVQPYGPFGLSEAAGRAMDEGYQAMATWLGTSVDQITIGPSTSANTYVLAQALRPMLRPGDQVVVTNQDHEANVGAWRRLEELGVEILEWRVDQDGELDPTALEALVTPRTRIVCFTVCSNIVGTINPIDRIVAIARQHGALTVADGVSWAPHLPLEVETSGLDFYLFSTYKVFGTHLGVLWGRREALARTTNQSHYFNAGVPRARLNPAGPQHAEIAALAGLTDYFDALYRHHFPEGSTDPQARLAASWALIRQHEIQLGEQLLAGLEHIGGFRLIGQRRSEHRVPVVSLIPERAAANEVARHLASRQVAVRNGHFYAMRLVEALGVDPSQGVLRISVVHYNTAAEIDRLLEGLAAL